MSTDPSAILYYGIRLSSEWPSGESEEFAAYHDCNDAWEMEYRPAQPEDKGNYRTPEWDAWREKYHAWQKTPQYVEGAWSGGENCYCYYIHAKALQIKVEWDEQQELPPIVNQEAKPEFDEWIKKFCERFKVPYSQPKWHLASRYF